MTEQKSFVATFSNGRGASMGYAWRMRGVDRWFRQKQGIKYGKMWRLADGHSIRGKINAEWLFLFI